MGAVVRGKTSGSNLPGAVLMIVETPKHLGVSVFKPPVSVCVKAKK